MFNARKPDTPVPFDTDRNSTASATSKPYAAYTNNGEPNCSIINEWLTMRGDLESTGDILVRGKIHGNILCKQLIIDAEAAIEGGIEADEVIVRGATRGTIKAKRIRVEKSANIDSEIIHESFSAEEGARIRGSLRHIEDLAEAVPAAKPSATVHRLDENAG